MLTNDIYKQLEFVQVKEMYNNIWDFEIQMYHLIPTRKADLMLINKKQKQTNKQTKKNPNLSTREFCRSSEP